MGHPAGLHDRSTNGPNTFTSPINISAVQFRSPGLMQVIIGALAGSGLAPTRLEIEITETVLLHNRDTTLAVLHQLRGARRSDRHGRLRHRLLIADLSSVLSFDKIKIDRSFVKDITESTGSLNIVRAIAALATGYGHDGDSRRRGRKPRNSATKLRPKAVPRCRDSCSAGPLPILEIERLS